MHTFRDFSCCFDAADRESAECAPACRRHLTGHQLGSRPDRSWGSYCARPAAGYCSSVPMCMNWSSAAYFATLIVGLFTALWWFRRRVRSVPVSTLILCVRSSVLVASPNQRWRYYASMSLAETTSDVDAKGIARHHRAHRKVCRHACIWYGGRIVSIVARR
jgi:hypothetical protein